MCRCVSACVGLYTWVRYLWRQERGCWICLELELLVLKRKQYMLLTSERSHQPLCSFELNNLYLEPRSRKGRFIRVDRWAVSVRAY